MKTLSTVVVILLALPSGLVGAQRAVASPSLLRAAFGELPLYFVENRGLYPDEVAYYIQAADKTLFFTKDGITFRLKGKDRGWVVRLEFVGANPDVVPRGEDRQQAVLSYFKGPEKDWKTGLKTYSKTVYRDLWPGIDLVYRTGVGALKYEFVVAPGADPDQIRLRYRGASKVEATEGDGLQVSTPTGRFEDAPPVAWQDIDGKRVSVDAAYRLDANAAGKDGATRFGFELGTYDPEHPLVLDPAVILYCGYVGGSSSDSGFGITVDTAGNTYVTGDTGSDEQTFPVAVGPDPTFNGGVDAFVAKVNAQGTGLVYCGYIGGAGREAGYSVAVDAAGNAYVTGQTSSTEQTFPVTVGPDLTHNGGDDAFVAKVNAQGTGLVYCGYIGGASGDYGHGIAVDAAGNAYVTGNATSTEQTFPVTVGPDLTHNGGSYDAFVAKVNAQGTGLVYCGYIGGSSGDYGYGNAVDAAGNAYVVGRADSTEQTFPVTVGPDLTHNGGIDTYIAKVNAAGTALVYCGYIGGSSSDFGTGIAVDATGSTYLTGYTNSTEQTFPVIVGPDLTHNGGYDAYVAKVNAAGTALLYCGYVGGSKTDYGYGVAADAGGNAYVSGQTQSDEQTFPVTVGPDLTHNGGDDAFVAKVNAQGTGLVYCGYIGGSGSDQGRAIAAEAAGNVYVVGQTQSTERTFPVTVGPDLIYHGASDAYVAKVTETFLVGGGAPNPGGKVNLSLSASADAGLPYQLGSSFGNGPIPIDARRLELSPDPLLLLSISGQAPWTFAGYAGILDPQGQATAVLNIPNIPGLKTIRIYTAFVTLKGSAPSGVSSISNTFLFTIQ